MDPFSIKTKEQILKMPINRLGLQIEGSLIEAPLKRLYAELDLAGIKFHPEAYLSDSWGCPNDVPVIGIPFYLTHPMLFEIEKEKTKEAETPEETAQILRHEAGHAFNYAYRLHELPRWKEIFGIYEKPYQDNFAPIAGSDKFVRHLEGWYAQKHPDEDFAETFAVLITPDLDWKKLYKGTLAYEKLAYVSELIKEYRAKEVPTFKMRLDLPIEELSMSLEKWYRMRLSAAKRPKILILFFQEYPQQKAVRDGVVDSIKEVLLELNYVVVLLPVNQSIDRITNGIKQEKPDLIFNLCETFRGDNKFEFNVTALLEMLRIPFTGSSSGSLFLTNDKHISKKILSYHRVAYPAFFIVALGREVFVPKNMSFPLFVKPVHQDASIGIDANSLVRTQEELEAKVRSIHVTVKDDALVEEYIDGREFYVSILGNSIPKPLEVFEIDFSELPPDVPKVYTHKAKIDAESWEYNAISITVPEDLPQSMKSKLQYLAVKLFRAFDARDYARIDFRVDAKGKIYVLEANLNPYLGDGDHTALAAEVSGLSYRELIAHIVESAIARARR